MPAGSMLAGSLGSSRMSSPVPMRRSASVGSYPHRAGAAGGKARKKKGESTWQLELTQVDGKPKKPGPEHAPDGEIKWRMFQLRHMGREHECDVDKMKAEDVAILCTYHNPFSRGPLQHALPPVHPVIPSRQLKDLGSDLVTTSQSLSNDYITSTFKLEDLLETSPSQRSRKLEPLSDASQEAPSMERLLEMASASKHWGPHMLQMQCQKARISVHTAAKLDLPPNDRSQSFDDDPLFSGRLGATPRTSTGKPLPVLHWGRNGSAPVLREAPELRQARSAAEAAR